MNNEKYVEQSENALALIFVKKSVMIGSIVAFLVLGATFYCLLS